MKITDTKIAGVKIVETSARIDDRGSFMRAFCANDLESVIGDRVIVQINHSRTASVGAIRGLHFQMGPHAEMKMIRCLSGRVFDVALDLRQGSPTFMQWHGEELTPTNMKMMVIPEGCAHGFQVLEAESELLYLHTAYYESSHEGAVHYADLRARIAWPLAITDVSERDAGHPFLDDEYTGIAL